MKTMSADLLAGCRRYASATLLSFLLLAFEAAAAPADLPPGFPAVALKARTRGEAAIRELGNKLPAVAAFYRIEEAELKKRLREDKMLWVDEHGRLLYICVFEVPEHEDEAFDVSPIDNGPVNRTQTFLLHSRKGASKVAYLDFDGHDASATSWGQDAIGVPFDLDGNESNFNTTERDRIQYIWQRVAEDFAMYDIDVTTEDPGIEALRKTSTGDTNYGIRVVIAGASGDWYGSAGGVAYLNSFDSSTDLPCWVFPGSLSQTEKNIAEATSHEIGHTLALSHDGKTDGTSYYTGHGNWAPIMGVGYSKPIVQWSRGEYNLANNTEDDLTRMLTEGISYRVDDHGNSIGAATLLQGVSFHDTGIIERTSDVDFFRFQTGAGRVVLTVTPAPRGANLHILLSLYNSVGTLLQSASVADTTAGVLPVTISTVLPTGTYYFSIDGIGEGLPASTGYSDYSSLGQYIINGTLIPETMWIPTSAGAFSWTNTANWISNNVPDAIGVTARLNNNIVGDQVVNLDKVITVGSLVLGDTNATHTFTLQNGSGGSLNFAKTSGDASLIKQSGLNDVITANISLASHLIVSNSSAGNLTISSPLAGIGGVTKNGVGNLFLNGPQNYSGATIVAGGKLTLDATASILNSPQVQILSGATFEVSALVGWTVVSNQTLSGGGVVIGNVTALSGAKISPGDVAVGTLSLSNNLVLDSGANLKFDVANSDVPGGGTNDLLVVGGDLSLNEPVTLDLNLLTNSLAAPGSYTLIRYGGALFGRATNISVTHLSTRYAFVLDDSVPGEIRLNVSGAPGSLVWQGDGSLNQWNLSATNWLLGGSPVPFANLDDILFDDTGSESPILNLTESVKPTSLSVIGAKNYTFSGGGKITGTTGISKPGSGTLTLNTSNDFTGPVFVSDGTLRIGNTAALGSSSGLTAISSGARLDINAQNLGAEPVFIAGSGLSGSGALINSSGTAQTNALRFVALSADATFGGSGRFDVRANPTATFTGNNFTLTKTGGNEIWLVDVGATGLGDINVNQGLFGVEGSTTLGNVTNTLTAAGGTRIGIWNSDINVLNKKWVLNGASVESLSGNNAIAGTMTLTGTNVLNSTSILQVQSLISGAGGLVKTGSGALTLAGANSFTGNFVVSNGTLIAGSTTALGSTNGTTTIANDARLDLNGLNLGAEPIIAQGNGLGNAGAIVNSGASQTSALRFITLSNNTTFGGINRWDLRANPTGSLIGNNFAVTKAGVNTIYLVDLGNTGLGNITISEGTLGVQGTTTLGNPANTLSIGSGRTLAISSTGTNVLAKIVSLSTGKISNVTGANSLLGTTTMTGSNTFDIVTSLAVGGNIGGSGSLWKITSGNLILTGTNNYTGVTVVSAGILQIGNGGGSGTLGSGAVTNNATLTFNRTNDFTVANVIAGTGTLNQNGTGVLTLSGNSSYSGSTVINSGTIAVGSDTTLGSGVLNFNGNNGAFRSANASTRTLANPIIFGGTTAILGSSGTGDLIFNNASVNNGTLTKTLIVSNAITTISGSITNSGAIIKSGPGTLVLGGNNTYVGTTTVNAGTLRIDAENRLGLNPASFNAAHLTLNGGTLQTTASFAIADANRGITLGANGGTFNVNSGTTLTLQKPMTGFGSLTKSGTGTLLTPVANNFSGATLISAGTLALSGSGSLPNTPTIDVAAASVLDVSGVAGFAIGNSQTLSGLGTINGTAQINGTVSPSGNAGRLALTDLLLRGTALLNLSKNGSVLTNDFLAVNNSLSLGGALVVSASGDSLSAGDSFKLFSASSITDTFASVTLPPLPSPLVWDFADLAVNGTIRVAVLNPQILPPVLDGANLLLSIQTVSGVNYILQTTPSLEAPVIWTSLSTNSGTGGILSFPIPMNTEGGRSFFRFVVEHQ